MLSRDFSHNTNKLCQLHQKNIPPHLECLQPEPNDSFKQHHYLLKPESVMPTQKDDSHQI